MKKTIFILLFLLGTNCASSTGIFPTVNLSTNESEIVMPNPISIIVDTARSQIVVANSNVDIFFDQGSLAVLAFDASNTSAPTLTASKLIAAPNFAGQMFFDGASSIYVPFRETSSADSSRDIFNKYNLSAGDISETIRATVAPDPYGIAGNAGSLYVVSDNVLGIYNNNLERSDTIDLTTAETANIDDSGAKNVLSVAIDTSNNLAVVGNPGGRMFIVDLSTNLLVQAVEGPTNSRDVLIDSDNILYVLDGVTKAVWIFDMNAVPSVYNPPVSLDDSVFILTTVNVGNNPNGMVLDETNNRLYVGNTSDDSISVIDTLTFVEIDRISLDKDDISSLFLRDGEGPVGLALGTFNSVTYLFVACFTSLDVVVINTQTLGVVQVFPNTVK